MKRLRFWCVVLAAVAISVAGASEAESRPNETGSFVSAGVFLCQFQFTGCMIESDGLGTLWIYWPNGGMSTYWWVDTDGDGLGYFQSVNGSTIDFDSDGNDPNHTPGTGNCYRTGPNPPASPTSTGTY